MSIKLGDEELEYLYKYRPLIGGNATEINKNTLKILENGELYFSKPSRFNDPFDSKVDYDIIATDLELQSYFDRQKFPAQNTNYIIEQVRSGTLDMQELAPKVGSSCADILNVFCLSKNEKNILMWSHYGKDHTGICIGFKVHIWAKSLNIRILPGYAKPVVCGIDNNFLPAVYVEYNDTKPKPYNIFKDDSGTVKK